MDVLEMYLHAGLSGFWTGYHGSPRVFAVGDIIEPWDVHGEACSYPGTSKPGLTYFMARKAPEYLYESAYGDEHALHDAMSWARCTRTCQRADQAHVYRTIAIGPIRHDANLGSNLTETPARVAPRQLVVEVVQ